MILSPKTFVKLFTVLFLTMIVFSVASLAAVKSAKMIDNKEKKQNDIKKDSIDPSVFNGLSWRSIGPAFTSGRIADFAVNPNNKSEWFVAVASGHVWKTVNNGTTFEPVFDNYGAYSIGCVTLDPNNSNVVWVGTGENNHQRSLGYGNGVYKSTDGGTSFTNMGLKDSRQIGDIIIDPRNSDVVYVAAEGSVWGPGGDRGLYKTSDGGKSWIKILNISENTGVNNVVFDPRNPDVLYATSEQRRRHVFTKIGGGPETAVYKSTDAGTTWSKIMKGLPSADLGGMGIAISPVNPDVIYLIAEAADKAGGFFRSTNRGASWQKMSDHTAQGQYYNEIYCDPVDVDRVYSMETVSQFTEDGGKTWKAMGLNNRHVDDHAFWIDPADTKHFMIGGDGGIYETYDHGSNYIFKSNLPVTQFYRVQVDNSEPFYYVYGGTQDNNSMGGPSRNISANGVTSDEWFVTNGGDGFWSQIDPEDPNIVYAESQYGGMVCYDRKSQEAIDIRPEPRKGEDTYKWNWNTPLILSQHSHTRLYCAANKVFRSDDRGSTWKVISDDLTTGTDRNHWPVMGKYWPSNAVAKDISTSLYGTIVSLDESPVKADLLYAGTDDGLIQVTENAGNSWTKIASFPGIPEYTYVSDILASKYDENVVFASFDNILRDDFKPYLLKSTDKGKTWQSIAGNLPENGTIHTIQQDSENPDLLFAGTEFGVYFTLDGGKEWFSLSSGLPSVSVRDMTIQKRENDLVIATFGRGFYILDDYSPLRLANKDLLKTDGFIFPVRDALMYIQSGNKYGQGSTVFTAKNPEFGATFTYYLKKDLTGKSLCEIRKEKEKELFKKGEPIPMPSPEQIKAEETEIAPYLTFVISDASGNIARILRKSVSPGIQRLTWDLRYQYSEPVTETDKFDPLKGKGYFVLAVPGKYSVSMLITEKGVTRTLAGPVFFVAKPLNNTSIPVADRYEVTEFNKKVAQLAFTMNGTERYAEKLLLKTNGLLQALYTLPEPDKNAFTSLMSIRNELDSLLNSVFNRRSEVPSSEENPPAPVTLNARLSKIIYSTWSTTSAPTASQTEAYEILMQEFPLVHKRIKELGKEKIPQIEKDLQALQNFYPDGDLPELK